MRALVALAALLAGCLGPADRWSLTGGSGRGEIEGSKCGSDFDTESRWLEAGVSGPIGRAPAPRRLAPCPLPPPPAKAEKCVQPAKPAALATEDSAAPSWMDIAYLAMGALGLLGSQQGVKKYRSRRKPP